MDAQNKILLKGGLPMSSSDFVEPDKAKETKLKILATLDHINEIHSEQMNPVDNSGQLNSNAIDNTVGIMNDEFKMDDYILADQIVRDDQPQDDLVQFAPVFANDAEMPNFENEEYSPVFEEVNSTDEPLYVNDDTQGADLNNMADNQGEPMFVMSDNELDKANKGKETPKTKEGKVKSTPADVKSGKKVAWLAYILFFIPLIFKGKNPFVRHHANEALELNIMDVIAVALFLAPKFINTTNQWIELALLASTIVGLILATLSTFTKIFLVIFSWAGKEATSPWFGKTHMIKKEKKEKVKKNKK